MTNMTRRTFGGFAFAGAAMAALPAWTKSPADWRLGFTTPPATLDGTLTRIEGRLPRDLEGALFRVGPAQFERAGERLAHWFDGDGMMQRFTIADGRVRHRGRFVDTAKRRNEEAAGRFLYPGYGFAPKAAAEIRGADDLNAANTNVLPIADEVWALWEGGSPYRVDPQSLETRGRKAFDGKLNGAPFSAHPKRGRDGDIWNFGVFGRRCVIWRLAPDGAVRKSGLIELPEQPLMHDFAVTSRHIVLLLPPMLRGPGPADSLVGFYHWHADQPLRTIILDKETLTVVRRHELPARFLFHIGNAWEDNAGVIRVDAFLHDDATFAVQTARDLALQSAYASPKARPVMMTFPLTGPATMETLPGTGEFPRIDPRRVGERHAFTYGVVEHGVARWDWQSGRQETFSYGDRTWSEEPVFVPRPGATDENDGWLVGTVLNYAAVRTELAVFDARHITDGPVAKYACPYPLPLGFHGAFVQT